MKKRNPISLIKELHADTLTDSLQLMTEKDDHKISAADVLTSTIPKTLNLRHEEKRDGWWTLNL